MLNRRELVLGGLGLGALLSLPGLALAQDDNGTMARIKAFAEGKTPQDGRIKLTMPEIAENGNTVPLGIEVDSPMTAEDHVKEVLVLASGNPSPDVAHYHFMPASGVAKADTRMRLAQTQDVIALAKMSDGSVWQTRSTVKVTIGGCGG